MKFTQYLHLFLLHSVIFLAGMARGDEFRWSVDGTLPLPPQSYTQGLVVDGTSLWLGTGKYGSSRLMELSLDSGKVLRTQNLSGNVFGEGVAIHQNRIVQLTWKAGFGYIRDKESLNLIDVLKLPGEGWGITTWKDQFIVSSGDHTLDFFNATNGRLTRSVMVTSQGIPVSNLNELELVNGFILANIWMSNRIVAISPKSGHASGYFDFEKLSREVFRRNPKAEVLNGIAWDPASHTLLISGKYWDKIYKIKVLSGPLAEPSLPNEDESQAGVGQRELRE